MENPIQETTDLFRFQITEEQEEERVDKCIAALIDSLSRSFIQKMIKEGRVCINGLPVKASYQVKAGDVAQSAGAGYRAGRHPAGHSL